MYARSIRRRRWRVCTYTYSVPQYAYAAVIHMLCVSVLILEVNIFGYAEYMCTIYRFSFSLCPLDSVGHVASM